MKIRKPIWWVVMVFVAVMALSAGYFIRVFMNDSGGGFYVPKRTSFDACQEKVVVETDFPVAQLTDDGRLDGGKIILAYKRKVFTCTAA